MRVKDLEALTGPILVSFHIRSVLAQRPRWSSLSLCVCGHTGMDKLNTRIHRGFDTLLKVASIIN